LTAASAISAAPPATSLSETSIETSDIITGAGPRAWRVITWRGLGTKPSTTAAGARARARAIFMATNNHSCCQLEMGNRFTDVVEQDFWISLDSAY